MTRPWRLEWPRKLHRAELPHDVDILASVPSPETPTERPFPLIHFLHIMKTGGTSLTNALYATAAQHGLGLPRSGIFLDELIRIDPATWSSISLASGHLPYETRDLLPVGTVSVTVLRDPVERTLSHYAEVTRNPAVAIEHPDLTIETFIESPRWRTLVEEYQTRQLAHRIGLTGAGNLWDPAERYRELGPPFPPEHELPLQCLFDCSPLPADRAQLLEHASANLARVDVVGTVDELDVVYRQVLQRWPGVSATPLGRDQVSDVRLDRTDLPMRLLRMIDRATQADRELYDQARRRGVEARRSERLSRVA